MSLNGEGGGGPGVGLVLGVFGFGTPGTAARETTGAVRLLRSEGTDARLVLVGAPGPSGSQADRWRVAAEEAGVSDVLRFTGVLPADALARELGAADIVVLPDRAGPASRNGTVAAALALGKPAVAVNGPERWPELVDAGALLVAEPTSDAFAEALRRLAGNPEARRRQSDRARVFYKEHMTSARVARGILSLVTAERPAESAGVPS